MDGFDCWSHPFSNGRKPNACLIINSIARFLQFVETLLCTNTSEQCNYVCQHLNGLFPHLVKPSFSLRPSRFFFSKTGLFVYPFHSAHVKQKHDGQETAASQSLLKLVFLFSIFTQPMLNKNINDGQETTASKTGLFVQTTSSHCWNLSSSHVEIHSSFDHILF